MFKHKKKEESSSPRPGQQSNWGDDEYAQLIEGVKKVYRNKIKPLEVTYNFEGMFSCSSQENFAQPKSLDN